MEVSTLQYASWWLANLLVGTTIFRVAKNGLVRQYLLFFFYLACNLLQSIGLFFVIQKKPEMYAQLYWFSELFEVVLGFLIIWQMYEKIFRHYPGLAKATRWMMAAGLLIFASGALLASLRSQPLPGYAVLVRDMRAAHIGFLVILIGLLTYYLIPVGRNTRGLVVGYSILVSATVINFALGLVLGQPFQPWVDYLQPLAYAAAVAVWCWAFWSYRPDPVPAGERLLEVHYQRAVRATAQLVSDLRAYVVGQART